MGMHVEQLTGITLDWAIKKAQANGCQLDVDTFLRKYQDHPTYGKVSSCRVRAGEIAEKKKISIVWSQDQWVAYIKPKDWFTGSTPMEAAMRCYVASRLGLFVHIPRAIADFQTL